MYVSLVYLISQRTDWVLDGLPSILELLRVLVNVLDPNDQQHTDSTRLTALGVLNAAFEEAGTSIARYPSLKAIVVDSGCKFLFQLARSENSVVLQWALRTISTVFDTMRQDLKLQQELFLTFTIDRLTPPPLPPHQKATPSVGGGKPRTYSPSTRPGTPSVTSPLVIPAEKSDADSITPPTRVLAPPARGEIRDLILENLSVIAGHPSFMVDLFTNYDCDINCENLFERLIDFLTKVTGSLFFIIEPSLNFATDCLSLASRSYGRSTERPVYLSGAPPLFC